MSNTISRPPPPPPPPPRVERPQGQAQQPQGQQPRTGTDTTPRTTTNYHRDGMGGVASAERSQARYNQQYGEQAGLRQPKPTVQAQGTPGEVARRDEQGAATQARGVSDADASARVTPQGIQANAQLRLGAEATTQGNLTENRIGAVNGAASTFGGAEATTRGSIGRNGVDANAQAFAGVRAGGSVTQESAFGSVTLRGELSAGAGLAGGARASYSDGHLRLGANLGATLGLGGRVGFNADINVGAIGSAIRSRLGF